MKLGSGGLGGALFGGPNTGLEPSFNPFSTTVVPPTNPFSSLSLSTPTPSPSAATKPSEPAHQGPSTPSKTYTPPFPAYLPAQYLTTFEEFLPADPNALAGDTAARVKVVSNDSVQGQGGKDSSAGQTGAAEQWERVLPKGVDEVFERFLERLSRAEDGEGQVLRYVFCPRGFVLVRVGEADYRGRDGE
jgi:pre-rRNA-processing protein TSR4